MAEVNALGDLAHEMENLFEKVIEDHFQVDSNIGELLLQCHDRIASMVDTIAEGYIPDPAEELIERMRTYLNTEPLINEIAPEESSVPKTDVPIDNKQANEAFVYDTNENELLGIFLDEAKDISNTIEESLAQWQDDPETMNPVLELQRELHTLKGGARLADIDPIGDLAEAFYERLNKVLDKELSVIEDNSLTLSLDALHILKKMLSSLEQTGTVQPATKLIQQLFGNQSEPASDSDKQVIQAEPPETTKDLSENKESVNDIYSFLYNYIHMWMDNINHIFLWIDLFKHGGTSSLLLAILAWILMYVQIKLTTLNKPATPAIPAAWMPGMPKMPDMSKMMWYMNIFMVFMMASFVYTMPAWIWIYIITSTLFTVVQYSIQYRELIKVKVNLALSKK